MATFLSSLRKVLPVDVDPTLAANSDSRVSSQKATKAYVDGKTGGAAYNLGNIAAGELGLNISDGPLQKGALLGDVVVGINGGVLGNKLTLQLEWTEGDFTVDFSGVKYPPDVAALFPVTLEALRCYRFNFIFVGGGWSLVDVDGPYTESVD